MRVTIATRIYRPEPAAASFFLGSVADALVEAGHDVAVLTVTPPRGLGGRASDGSRGERVRTFPVLRDKTGYVRGYVQYMSFDVPLAFRLLFSRRPDAVFVEPPPTTGAVVRVVCAIRRIPYVYDAADIWSDAAGHATGSGLVVKVLRAFEKFAMRGATNMVTISQGVVDRVRALGINAPMTVTGFGADTSVFSYERASIERVFTYAGTYTGLHGAEVLIDAFAKFSKTHPGYRLRFIGNGTGQAEMRDRARALGIGIGDLAPGSGSRTGPQPGSGLASDSVTEAIGRPPSGAGRSLDNKSNNSANNSANNTVEFLESVPAEELQPMLNRSLASLATLRPGGGYEYAFTSKVYSSLASGCPAIFAGPGPTAPFMRDANEHVRAGHAVEYDADEIAEAMREIADQPLTAEERESLSDWASTNHSMTAVAHRVADVIASAGRGRMHKRGSATNATATNTAHSALTVASASKPSLMGRLASWAVKHRSKMPRWVGRVMESAARNPDGFVGRVSAKLLGGGGSGPVTDVPDMPIRVYVAPTNYAGQGYLWARALESADPRIGARNMAVDLPGGYAFPADTLVPIATVNASSEWASAEWTAAKQFSHVLMEAERSLFGRQFGRSLEAEVDALEDAGVSVAFLCHGTDIRDPEHHAQLTPWSPYPEDPRTATLQQDARENLALLERLKRPTFISTPDLAADVPWATWCPVVVDAARFETNSPAFATAQVRVIHASSNPLQKGSDRIEPALAPLVDAGDIEYSLITATPSAEMPGVFAAADIVLDQFRLGSYGVAACEAMAAGRVVVGHVLPAVRERVERDFGITLPIVEATPDTLREVVRDLVADPDRAREIAASGPDFVDRVHSGTASADALISGWIDGPHTS